MKFCSKNFFSQSLQTPEQPLSQPQATVSVSSQVSVTYVAVYEWPYLLPALCHRSALFPLTEIVFFLLHYFFTLSSFCIVMAVFPSPSWFWLLVGSLVCAREGLFMFSSETKLGMPEPIKIHTQI